MKREVRCSVCGKAIRGAIPVILIDKKRVFTICSWICHLTFEKDPRKYRQKGRRRRKPWLSRRRQSSS